MKPVFFLLFILASQLHAEEKKYFECEAKIINQLELPYKSHFEVDEQQRRVAISIEGDRLNVISLKTLEKVESYDVSDFYVASAELSPDNRFILVKPVRKNIKAQLIDRITGEKKPDIERESFWLKENLLGAINSDNEGTQSFITTDPHTLKEEKLLTPGMDKEEWSNFTSKDADLISVKQGQTTEVKVYSLKEKMQKVFHLEGIVRQLDLDKHFAIVSTDNSYKVISLKNSRVLAELKTEKNFSFHLVGNVLYLEDSYGFFSTNTPDRRPYQRLALDLSTEKSTRLDYTGPWQALTPVSENAFTLQVIDSIDNADGFSSYYSIMTNDMTEILRVQSPAHGFTSLHRINNTLRFSIQPSSSYAEAKFKGQVGLFDLKHPDQIQYYFIGDEKMDQYTTYAPAEDKLVTTTMESWETKKGQVLKLWQMNQSCHQTDYRF